MTSKFKFLLKDSLRKKTTTKSFKIINIILCLIIVVLVNLDGIIKLFGGDFNEVVKIYVVDEVNAYDAFKYTMDNTFLDTLGSYNAEIVKSEEDVNVLKENIIKEESDDIIIVFKSISDMSAKKVFDVSFISYEYVDSILYQSINSAINTTKSEMALSYSGISPELLNDIYLNVEIDRVLLDSEVKEDEELIQAIGGVICIIFVLPIFMLIILIVQMIGAEINEEKTSRSMEIIISSVSPETHFMSKLFSANLFAIIQGVLLILYVVIGFVIKGVSTPNIVDPNIIEGVASSGISEYITIFLESELFGKLLIGVPFFIVLIIFSFVAYSLFIGILASVTTSMEDFNQIQTPVMVFLMVGYYLALFASTYQGSIFLEIMAYIPFISGILAPVMYTLGEMTILGLIGAILLLVVVCFLLYKYGLKVYKVGILNYSSSKLWSKIFKALKN